MANIEAQWRGRRRKERRSRENSAKNGDRIDPRALKNIVRARIAVWRGDSKRVLDFVNFLCVAVGKAESKDFAAFEFRSILAVLDVFFNLSSAQVQMRFHDRTI